MRIGNPRSSTRCDLGFNTWFASFGVRSLQVFFVPVAVWWISSSATAWSQDAPEPSSPLDLAEVESLRVFEPEEDLLLDEDGQNKRGALLAFYRGICLEGTDMPAALKHFRKVLELDPANVGLAMETAAHCAVYGKFSEALEILEESLEQNPGNRDAYLNISRYCDTHHNGDQELQGKALIHASAALERFPLDHVVIEHLVSLLMGRDDKERAEMIVKLALEKKVKQGGYWLAMGAIAQQVWPLRKEENRERITKIYETALKADPENFATAEKVARFHKLIGNLPRATQIYEVLVRRSPDQLGVREELAGLYWEQGRRAEAIAGLEALIRIDPEELDVRRRLSAYYQQMERPEKAIEQSEAILKIRGVEVEDFIRMAELQLSADKIGGALQTLRRGVAIFPEAPRLNYFLGMVYVDLDRYTDAFDAFQDAEELGEAVLPEMLTELFYFQYGMSAERCGKFERAEELFGKSIELVPEDAEEEKAKSLNYLGYMWLEREERIDEAGDMIIKANDLKPNNAAYLDSLGWFHYLKDDYDLALKHLLRALELLEGEEDPVVLEHIARAYFADGDAEKAKAYLDRAIALEPDKKELKSLREEFDQGPPAKDDSSVGSTEE